MSGFIGDTDDDRIDRLDALIDLLLPTIPLDALSPEVREVVEDLTSDDPERVRRGRIAYRAAYRKGERRRRVSGESEER